ncbi:MAG: hypothetical protein V7K35_19825 [Nostoc sp.]
MSINVAKESQTLAIPLFNLNSFTMTNVYLILHYYLDVSQSLPGVSATADL